MIDNNSDLPRFVPVTPSPREWRVGDVLVNNHTGIEWCLTAGSASDSLLRVVSRRSDYGSVSRFDASLWTNLGPHCIEPDGNDGLKFVKVERAEKEGWVQLHQAEDMSWVQVKGGRVGLLTGRISSNGRDYHIQYSRGVTGQYEWLDGLTLVRVLGTLELPKQESK